MTTTITIGYATGEPLEASVSVALVIDDRIVETARPDARGMLTFQADLPQGASARLHYVSQPRDEAGD